MNEEGSLLDLKTPKLYERIDGAIIGWVFLTLLACLIVPLFVRPLELIQVFYAEFLRSPIFQAMLVAGVLTMVALPFMASRVKSMLADHPIYREEIAKLQGARTSEPVKTVHRAGSVAALAAILTAFVQITVGLIPHWSASLLCIGAAVLTVRVLLIVLSVINTIMSDWYACVEEETRRVSTGDVELSEH